MFTKVIVVLKDGTTKEFDWESVGFAINNEIFVIRKMDGETDSDDTYLQFACPVDNLLYYECVGEKEDGN